MLDKHEDEFIRMGVPNMQGGLSEDEVEVAQIFRISSVGARLSGTLSTDSYSLKEFKGEKWNSVNIVFKQKCKVMRK